MRINSDTYFLGNGKRLTSLFLKLGGQNPEDISFVSTTPGSRYEIYHVMGTTCLISEKELKVYGTPRRINRTVKFIRKKSGAELTRRL